MSKLILCPDCGKLISPHFPVHHCAPKPKRALDADDKWDRFTTSVQITANKPLTEKQWQAIHDALKDAFEDRIAESEKFTRQIGHVHLGSPFHNGLEICP